LAPSGFLAAAIIVYVAGAASQLLTMPPIIARGGLWLFAAVQVLLVWVWFVLHARRLRDCGRAVGPAASAAVLYALSVALLVILAASFYHPLAGAADANGASALGLILVVSIIAILLGSPQADLAWFLATIFTLIAFVPVFIALGVTLWAATRPRKETA
jgi:hypothetical protein